LPEPEETPITPFKIKCEILGDLWMTYRHDSKFKDFIEYNDIGLPLGFLVSEDLVQPHGLANNMIEETFNLLLAALEIEDDTGFDSLDDLLVG